MTNIQISKVSSNDIVTLQNISRQTFYETFASFNTAENIHKYMEESFSTDKLSEEQRNEDSEFYFVAFENKIIGYLKINFGSAQTELNDLNAAEIERIYVLREFHGQQIGKVLLDKAVTLAREKKAYYLWLGVWEHNPRALRFYTKNGFETFAHHSFKLGEEEQTDIMMKLVLQFQ